MPNRIIRESCLTSPNLNAAGLGAECLFWRLTTAADDYGRFEADTRIVKGRCFPLRDNVKIADVDRWLKELVRHSLIQLYEVQGKRYGAFLTWEKHQHIRAKRSKHPEPTSANVCQQVLADDSKCPRNPIQSNPNPIQTAPSADGDLSTGQEKKPPTPLQRVVDHYLRVRGVDATDARQVRAHYDRSARAATALLDLCGQDVERALMVINYTAKLCTSDGKNLTWTLETTHKHVATCLGGRGNDGRLAKLTPEQRANVRKMEAIIDGH